MLAVKEGLIGVPVAAQLKNWLSRQAKEKEKRRSSVSEHAPPNKQPMKAQSDRLNPAAESPSGKDANFGFEFKIVKNLTLASKDIPHASRRPYVQLA